LKSTAVAPAALHGFNQPFNLAAGSVAGRILKQIRWREKCLQRCSKSWCPFRSFSVSRAKRICWTTWSSVGTSTTTGTRTHRQEPLRPPKERFTTLVLGQAASTLAIVVAAACSQHGLRSPWRSRLANGFLSLGRRSPDPRAAAFGHRTPRRHGGRRVLPPRPRPRPYGLGEGGMVFFRHGFAPGNPQFLRPRLRACGGDDTKVRKLSGS